MLRLYLIFFSLAGIPLFGQEIPDRLDFEEIEVEFINQTWFTDRVGHALIYFDTEVEEPEELPSDRVISFIDVEVVDAPDNEKGKFLAKVRFLIRETGPVTFPSIRFLGESRSYRTLPKQILVGEPVRSEAMSLSLTPSKRKVYVGEPLRVDFEWSCDLDASRLRAFDYYPEFFNNSEIEIVIPRNVDPEDQQVGLPMGGRRVIARRTQTEDAPSNLGTVELPLFLRFSEPGVYELPATRLECAYISQSLGGFALYAAHFNNDLFSPEDPTDRYERFYIETDPVTIEVLALPEVDQRNDFSGIFDPVDIEISVFPTELVVGQLMEVEIKVFSHAPHGMIEFPQLSRQRGLRGRFLVDDNLGRFWRADGTTFRGRIRALSTDVQAFPSLSIQVFDTNNGDYEMLLTEPQPLEIQPVEGQSFVSLDTYKDVRVSLVGQPDGIWHNYEANIMDDIFNKIVAILISGFWPLVICGPIAFVLLLPLVLERRRRNMDARYRTRMETFEAFKRFPEGDPGKWEAFQSFLAASFDSSPGAWTVEDSRGALEKIGASDDDIEKIVHLHQSVDAKDFHPEHPPVRTVELNPLGKRILNLISKSALLLLCFFLIPDEATASDWSEAEKLFEQAIKAPAGSKDAMAFYMDAALKFQSAAEAGERPGIAWYNSGNAWFRSGALGRSIAAYLEARVYRPFDPLITENLIAARSLTLTEMREKRGLNSFWSGSWLKALFAVVSVFFWILLLCYFRYRKRSLLIAGSVIAMFATGIIGLLLLKAIRSEKHGVVIVEEVFARKGPAYSYEKAFTEPLQDGLEFTLREARGDWGLIVLPDGRQCWTPLSQVQLLSY